MSNVPSEDLNVIAMQLDADYRAKITGPTMSWPPCVLVASLECEFSEGTEHIVWFRTYDTRGALMGEGAPDATPFMPQKNGKRLGRVIVAEFNSGSDESGEAFEITQPGVYLFGLVVDGKQLSVIRVEAVAAPPSKGLDDRR